MKNSHLYQRMSNYNVFNTYMHMIKTNDLQTVNDLMENITNQADDHPRYNEIVNAYQLRLQNENNKE